MTELSSNLAAFLGVSMLVIASPGPDTALTIRNTLLGGRGPGRWTAAGVTSGQLIWTVATSAGLAALIIASEPVFTARPCARETASRARHWSVAAIH